MSLLLVDIDHFKRLNDEHGHQVGDDVLRDVARVLSAHARAGDVAARYGGEEFALILADTDLEAAALAAERLRKAVAAGSTVPVTVSIGAASFPRHGATGFDLIQTADSALYAAKTRGRNRVVAAPNVTVPMAAL
jgi:diguanylate cyclase (GGDEF)-like protein